MKVIVLTLHKSASDFLFRYFRYIKRFTKCKTYSESLNNEKEFKTRNPDQEFIYAPYRVTDESVEMLSEELDNDCIYIVHIRNPIDILISEYYSYGFMHTNEVQETSGVDITEYRETIKKMSVDRYCIEILSKDRIHRFNIFYKFISKNIGKPNFFISSYSLMKDNFEKWNSEITSILNLKPKQSLSLFESFKSEFDVEPLNNEDVRAQKVKRHVRNGTTKQYVEELNARATEIVKIIFRYHIPFNIKDLPDLVL